MHWPLTQLRPPVQALPQPPQWLLSVWRFRHPPEQQVFAAPEQTLPHAPQLLLSFWRSLHSLPQQVLLPHCTSQPPQLLLSLTTLRQAYV
jgi:hypothetical protein